jgi:hypothetical protein
MTAANPPWTALTVPPPLASVDGRLALVVVAAVVAVVVALVALASLVVPEPPPD